MDLKITTGAKEFLKHFFISWVLFFLAYYSVGNCEINNQIKILLVTSVFSYIFIFFLGRIFGWGPLKYIGKLYVEEQKKIKRAKQPWE